MKIIAHRGAPLFHQLENTLSTFMRAVRLGVDMVEIDVRVTKEGIPIVFHDNAIDRVTEGSGLVKHFSLNNVQKLKIGRETIPTVEEVIIALNNETYFNFDVKVIEAIEPLKALIEKYGLVDKTLISSFDKDVIRELGDFRKRVKVGILTWFVTDRMISFAKEYKLNTIHPYYLPLTRKNVEEMQNEGFKVNAWTVDYIWSMKRMFDIDVDGIITNNPLLLNKVKETSESFAIDY
ncbi:hypothetical protein KKH43_05850 [Patescibacteria group bacterium]|nr:hypothetical protein [Patescibacteria group bacterium]